MRADASRDPAPDEGTRPWWVRRLPERFASRLQGRSGLLAIVHNTGWLLADKALRMLLGVLVGAWMARYLGPSQFGEISYVLSFVAFFAVLSQLGLDGVAVRDMARNGKDSHVVLGTTLRLRLGAGFACWAASVAAMALLRPGDGQALLLTVIVSTTLVLQAADTVDLWFQSQTQSRRTVVAKAVAYVGANSLKVALIVAGAPLAAFAAVSVLELGLAAAALAWSYRKFPAASRWRFDGRRALALLSESASYLVAALAVMVYMRIDQLMLRDMVGERELGFYSAALPLSTALQVVPMALCSSVAPAMARLRVRDPQAYDDALRNLFSLMWLLMLPASAILASLSSPIVSLLYGHAYAPAAPMLAVHVFASVPVALGVAQSLWIVNEGRHRISLYRTVLGAATNVALNLLLIPRLGGLGAAMASVAAQTAAAIVSNLVLAPKMLRLQLLSLVQPQFRLPSR